jgi:hypothetical protein
VYGVEEGSKAASASSSFLQKGSSAACASSSFLPLSAEPVAFFSRKESLRKSMSTAHKEKKSVMQDLEGKNRGIFFFFFFCLRAARSWQDERKWCRREW